MNGQTAAAAATSRPAQPAPVVILGYPHSGAARLMSLLSDSTELACTSGTGLLPLCDQAAAVWQRAEDKETGQISALAAASIRAMASAMLSQILARTGRDRWCEFAIASQETAETFLRLYPATRFVCLHRGFTDVARTAIRASPWGLAGPGFAPFVNSYPGSTLAAVAAWWTAHTSTMLTLERNHPHEALRVRYEDLEADQPGTASAIAAFLGVSNISLQAATDPGPMPAAGTTADSPAPQSPPPEPPIPLAQLPPPLLTQVNDLLQRLSYPPLTG
jgi:hypothetical protein